MKKIRSKLSLVLLLILSFVVMVGATASMLVSADSKANGGSAVVEVYSDDWYEITITEDSLTVLLSAEIGSYRSVSRDDLTSIKNAAKTAVMTLVVDQILKADESSYAAPAALAISADDNLKDMYARYTTYLENRLSQTVIIDGMEIAAELGKFLDGQYDALIEYAATRYINDSDNSDADLEALIEKAHEEVKKIIEKVLDNLAEGTWVGDKQITSENKDAILEELNGHLTDVSKKIFENDGKMSSIGLTDLLDMVYSVNIGGYQIYNGKFIISEIRDFLSSLPTPAEIAAMADDEMNICYNVLIETTLGNVDFDLTVGFMGDAHYIRTAAQFIADHLSMTNEGDAYTVEVLTPDELAAVLLKLSNTSRIPDDIKHAAFSLFTKTGDEIFDKASEYSYQQILDFLKGKDFQSVFAAMIDAQRIKDYFSNHGVELSKLTNENIDRVINKILYYAERIANKQDVKGIEEFLESLGVPVGVPSQLEGAVQKFLNLLNKIDYKYWNATTIREFLNDKTRVNAKVDALLTKLANSTRAEKLYNAFVSAAEKVFNYLPQQIHNETILDLYQGNGELTWAGNLNYDIKGIITKVIEKLVPYVEKAGFANIEEYTQYVDEFIDSYFEGDMVINVDLSLTLSLTNIYKVEYVVDDEVIGAGLLPVGADVVFFANKTEVDGRKIIAWVDEDGNAYEEMPAQDVTLYAITEFEAYIAVDEEEVTEPIEKTYDGEAIVLTVEIEGLVGANPTYTWYKDGEILEGAEGATLELVNVTDSGVYYCVVTNNAYGAFTLSATTQEVTVIINKAKVEAVVTPDTDPYIGAEQEPEITLTSENGTVLEAGVDYEVTYTLDGETVTAPKKAGEYTITITLIGDAADNYELLEDTFTYTITKAAAEATVSPETNIYNGAVQKPDVTITGEKGETLTEGEDYTVTYTLNGAEVTEVKNVGVYTVTITLIGDAAEYYELDNDIFEYEIIISKATATVSPASKVYNGSTQAPTIIVTGECGETLKNGTHYSVTYNGSTALPKDAGTYTVKITLKGDAVGNYKLAKSTFTYTITEAEAKVEIDTLTAVYNGEEQKPEITVTGVNGALVEGTDYTVTYAPAEVINVGEYTITIELIGTAATNYVLSETTLTYEITVAEATVEYDTLTAVYNGKEQKAEITVTGVNGALVEGEDYEIVYAPAEVKNAGEYTITITLIGDAAINYELSETTLTYTITKAKLTVMSTPTSRVYNGSKQEPTVTVKDSNGITLKKTTDYEVSFARNGSTVSPINAGTYTVVITLKGDAANNYELSGNAPTFTITKATLRVSVTPTSTVYNGSKQEPTVTVTGVNNTILTAGTDYTVSYSPNGLINAGTYYVTITLKGTAATNYNSVARQTYIISKATLSEFGVSIEGWTYGDEANEPVVTGNLGNGTVTYKYVGVDNDYSGTTAPEDAGTYTLTASVSATTNYNAATASCEFTIAKAELQVTVSPKSTDYTGKAQFPEISIKGVKGALEAGVDFEVTYTDANGEVVAEPVNVGTYTITITLIGKAATNYEAITEEFTFTINGVVLDFSGYWYPTTNYVYDGTEKSVEFKLYNKFELPEGVTLEVVGNTATNAGKYNAYVVITCNADLYTVIYPEIGSGADNPFVWEIERATLRISEYAMFAEDLVTKFVFDGKEHGIDYVAIKTLPELTQLDPTGIWSEVNANKYTGILTISTTNPNYKVDEEDYYILMTWEIEAAVVNLRAAGARWDYTAPFIFDGNVHTVKLYDETIFNGVELVAGYKLGYAGNAESEVGTHVATVVVLDSNGIPTQNYKVTGISSCTWEIISEVTLDFTGYVWTSHEGYVYNGTEYTVTLAKNGTALNLNGDWGLAEGYTLEYVGNKATNAGTYNAYIAVMYKGNVSTSYIIKGLKDGTVGNAHEWAIAKAPVSFAAPYLVKVTDKDFVYDGVTTFEVKVAYESSDLFNVTVSADSKLTAKSAGTYYVFVTVALTDEQNYVYTGNTSYVLEWTISPAPMFAISGSWKADENWGEGNSLIFNGSQHSIEYIIDFAKQGLSAEDFIVYYVGTNMATNVGTYTVTVKIVSKDGNYGAVETDDMTITWTIKPYVIDLTGYVWSDANLTYNNAEQSVKLAKNGTALDLSAIKLVEGYEIKYFNDKATNAGMYYAYIAIVAPDDGLIENYAITGLTAGNGAENAIEWTIVKKVITVDTSWSTTVEFKYDEAEHEVTFTKFGEYAEYVTVNVSGNKATEAGEYIAVAELTLKDEYKNNYELSQSVYTLSWKIVGEKTPDVPPQPPVQDNTTLEAAGGDLPEGVKVKVTASKPLPEDCKLVVSAQSTNEYSDDDFNDFVASGTMPKLVHVYAIAIENLPADYDGEFTVTISNTEFAGKDLIVVHVPLNADGTPTDKEQWSNTDANLAGNNLTFGTEGFSDFAVVEQIRISDNGDNDNNSLWLMWLMLAIIIVLIIVVIILLIKLLRNNGDSEKNDEIQHPVVIIKSNEETADENPQA